MEEGSVVLYVPTACQRRQKRRSLCYLADCDLLSVVLTKNNKITSLPHSSSQGKNQSTPCFTMKRLWWQMHHFSLCQSVTYPGLMWQSKSMLVTLILNMFSKRKGKKKGCCAFCSWHCPPQPFHARGRFELDAGCMRRRGGERNGVSEKETAGMKQTNNSRVKHHKIVMPGEKACCIATSSYNIESSLHVSVLLL